MTSLFQKESLSACGVCGSRQLTSYDSIAELVQCSDCSFVFANPRPTLRELEIYYSKPSKYEDWLSSEADRDALWARRLRKMQKTKKPGSLLDIGAGIGQLLHHAQRHYTEVFGTELSDSAIEIAKSKYGLDMTKGDFDSIVFNRKFDNISLFHIVEHVPDPRRLLEKCFSLLSPGGRVIIAVPNDLNSWEVKARAAWARSKSNGAVEMGTSGLRKIVLDGTIDEIHLSQFTPQSLRYLLQQCGFEIVQESLDPYFAKHGVKYAVFNLIYLTFLTLHAVTGINRYNTIWMVASRPR